MKYTATFFNISKKVYDVLPTIKIIEKFSEELDMFEFTLATLDEKIDFDFTKYNGLIPIVLNMFDDLGNSKNLVMFLSSYKYNIVEFEPIKYQCLIQATSSNIKLQRIDLPNKLITQHELTAKRSVWTELNKIMQVYAPDIMINKDLEEKMSMPCPELQFVKATLYEVLVTLFAVCGLIPKMDNEYTSYLSFIELKKSGINYNFKDHLIMFEESNSINEYADMYDYDIENAISSDADMKTGWIIPTSDEGIVNVGNFFYKVPTTIYEIEKVEITTEGFYFNYPTMGDYFISQPPYNLKTLDITENVVSKEVYDTLLVSSALQVEDLKYKRTNFYYEDNAIRGVNYNESNWFPTSTTSALETVVNYAFKQVFPNVEFYVMRKDNYPLPKIKVTYKSETDNSRVKIVKNNVKKPENSLISNQEESYIDIVNFGKQKQETINRMGNIQILGQANYDLSITKLNDIPSLGDTFENDYIIVEKQIQMNENNMLVNYKLSKDYVYETGYSGLNQIKRFTSIDTKNTVIRNDNFLNNYILTTTNNNLDYKANLLIDNYGKKTNGLNFHYVKTFNEKDLEIVNDYILVQTQNKVIADSIISQFKFETNAKAGNSIEKKDGYSINKPIAYTNLLGEFKTLRYYFGQAENEREVIDDEILNKRPLVVLTKEPNDYDELLIYKDNREITSITQQFRIIGDKEKDIFVYNNFAKFTQLTSRKEDCDIKVYCKYYKNENDYLENKYNEFSKEIQGEEITSATITFGNNKIKISGVGDMNYYCLLGVTVNDELVLGINFLLLSAIPSLELYLNRI